MKSSTLKALEAAIKHSEKIHRTLADIQAKSGRLDSEIREEKESHRQASLNAALAGDPAPTTPPRIAQATQELETSLAVRDDLRQRCAEAKQAEAEAEEEHTAARRMAITAKLEKVSQEHFKTLGDAYVKLIESAGVEGWQAVKGLVDLTVLYPDKDPVKTALAAEGLDHGKGSDEFSVLPDGAYLMDFTDRAFEAHNGEPAPVEKTCRI